MNIHRRLQARRRNHTRTFTITSSPSMVCHTFPLLNKSTLLTRSISRLGRLGHRLTRHHVRLRHRGRLLTTSCSLGARLTSRRTRALLIRSISRTLTHTLRKVCSLLDSLPPLASRTSSRRHCHVLRHTGVLITCYGHGKSLALTRRKRDNFSHSHVRLVTGRLTDSLHAVSVSYTSVVTVQHPLRTDAMDTLCSYICSFTFFTCAASRPTLVCRLNSRSQYDIRLHTALFSGSSTSLSRAPTTRRLRDTLRKHGITCHLRNRPNRLHVVILVPETNR